MLLSVEKTQEFLRMATIIKPNILYQSLDHILIECTGEQIIFTKTNNNIFCQYAYDDDQPPIRVLVPERMLQGFIMDLPASVFSIDVDKQVSLTCGTKINKFSLQDPMEFPVMPRHDKEADVQFDLPLIEAIAIAKAYVSSFKSITAANFVHVNNKGVFATDQQFVYHKAFDVPIDTHIFLDAEASAIVALLGSCEYASGKNYDFYSKGATCFAHIKNEVRAINFNAVLCLDGSAGFTISKQELINFCTWVQYTAKQEYPIAEWAASDGNVQFYYNNSDFNRQADTKVPATIVGEVPSFRFCAPRLRAALSVLPYEKLCLINVGQHYKVTTNEDDDYIGIIAGLQ